MGLVGIELHPQVRGVQPIALEQLLPAIAIGFGLALLIFANREWSNLQIRHVWCIYPFTLLGLVVPLRRLPDRARAWGRTCTGVGLAAAVLLNAHLLSALNDFGAPRALSDGLDRSYTTFMYLYLEERDQDRVRSYLWSGR